MSVEQDFVALLLNDSAVAALVDDRITPDVLPDHTQYPAITYKRISALMVSAMGADTGLVRARFQFDAWSQSFAEAQATRKAIINRLKRYRGTGTVEIQAIFSENEFDLYEGDTRLHHLVVDFEINYRE